MNASIKTEKTYTLCAGGQEFPGWTRKEGWEGFAKLEREGKHGKEIAITVDPSAAFASFEIFGQDQTTVLKTTCTALREALEKAKADTQQPVGTSQDTKGDK